MSALPVPTVADAAANTASVPQPAPDPLAARLCALARGSDWLMQALRCVRALGLPQGCIGAGALRDLVWDHLHGQPPRVPRDVDVAWFDASRLSPELDRALEARLARQMPQLRWDVVNQAAVHLWFERVFGAQDADVSERPPIRPLKSVEDGIATWPETATAVALRLQPDGQLQVIAPFGLADLFAGIVRHNPARASAQTFRERCATKRYAQRWPRLTLLGPAQ